MIILRATSILGGQKGNKGMICSITRQSYVGYMKFITNRFVKIFCP
jgi:hypothetical protein